MPYFLTDGCFGLLQIYSLYIGEFNAKTLCIFSGLETISGLMENVHFARIGPT